MRPKDLRYSKQHEWVRLEGEEATIGITDFAATELGDIVYLELPEPGRKVRAGESLGSIETVKAVEDLYSPVDGVVLESNVTLQNKPELVNEDPFGEGWMVRVQVSGIDQDELMDAGAYAEMLGE
jgi:glycine cleavage system H protein